MMKYHLVLMSGRNTVADPLPLCDEMNVLRREMRSSLPKLHKQDHCNCPTLFYLHDKSSILDLFSRLNDHDELVIHAEGFPFFVGFISSNQYNLTAFQLAACFNKHNMPDVNINLNLLTCNSATEFEGINFARDLSKTLNLFFDYQHISVTGYTGYVVVKPNAKYSVSSLLSHTEKGSHAKLAEARNVYRNGNPVSTGRMMCDFTNIDFSWAADFINRTKKEQSIVSSCKTNLMTKVMGQLFYKPNNDSNEQSNLDDMDNDSSPTPDH